MSKVPGVAPYAHFADVSAALEWADEESKKRGLRLEIRKPTESNYLFTVVDADEEEAARIELEEQVKLLEKMCPNVKNSTGSNRIRPSHNPHIGGPGNAPGVEAVLSSVRMIAAGKHESEGSFAVDLNRWTSDEAED